MGKHPKNKEKKPPQPPTSNRSSPRVPEETGVNNERHRHKVERYMLIIGIATLFVGILTLFCGIWAIRSSEDIALESGALDKASPQFYLGNVRVSPSSDVRIIYGATFSKGELTFCELPIVIRNDGQKTLKRASVTLRAIRGMLIAENDYLTLKVHRTIPFDKKPGRHAEQIAAFTYVNYELPDLHPGQAAMISEPLQMWATNLNENVPVVFRGGQHGTVGLSLSYSVQVTLSITGEDERTTDYHLDVSGVRATSLEELKTVAARELTQELKHSLSGLSWKERLVERLTGGKELTSFLILARNKTTVTKAGTVSLPSEEESGPRVTEMKVSGM